MFCKVFKNEKRKEKCITVIFCVSCESDLHCRIAARTNFLLLMFPARFAHARYSSRMIDRFLNSGDHGKPKSGKIKGRCYPPPPSPSPSGQREVNIYSMRIDSAKRFAFSFMYCNTHPISHLCTACNTQFRTTTKSTFRMKKVDSSFLV